jgi:proline dehydrogenase
VQGRVCQEPESVAFQDGDAVDKSYVRCLKVLMKPVGATPWWPATTRGSSRSRPRSPVVPGREPKSFEYQMLYGIRPDEQQRIADRGDQMRVYVPFGDEWYGYLMRRMAERPANVAFFIRGLATKG